MPKINRPGINDRAEIPDILNIQRRYLCNWLNTLAIIIDGYSDLYNGSNDLDDSGNKSDSHNSLSFLRILFFPVELGGDFPETDLNVGIK